MKVGNNIRKVLYSETDDIKNSLILFDSLSRSIFLIGWKGLIIKPCLEQKPKFIISYLF